MYGGRLVPFFDMSPDEFWSRRYASVPPEFFEGFSSRPAMMMTSGRPLGGSQTSHSVQRREYSSGGSGSEGFPRQLFDQHFGGDAWPSGNTSTSTSTTTTGASKDGATSPPAHVFYIKRPGFQRQISGSSEVQTDEKCFKVSLDVQQFTPDELDVRVVDREVLVHAKHEQRQDEHGTVTREFTRRYNLPEDVDPDAVKSSLSEEGILSIEAPRKLAIQEPEGIKVSIKVEAKPPAPEDAPPAAPLASGE